MIFKTIDSSIDSSRKSITLFNKDWNTYVSNLKNASGIKGKAISIISSNDVNCLRAYNQQIINGIKPSQAYKNTMSSCTKEAKQQAVAIAKGTITIDKATESIKKSTLAATANKIAMSAMSIALNIGTFMLISTAVSKLVSVFNDLIHSEENLRQSASALGLELSNNSSDIESYKKKIEELKSVINDSSSSFDEVSQARVDLMAVQDELIEKFGTESKYKVIEYESAYGGYGSYTASVTKDEELLNAIEAYDDYKAKVDDANKALAEMAQTGNYSQKQWKKQEKIVEKYSQKMDDARSHANELALTLSEQKQGLNGNTEASQELIDTVDRTLDTYNGWLDAINGTTDALIEQADAQKTTGKHTFSLTETQSQSIDEFQAKVKTLSDTLAALNSGTFSQADITDLLQEFPQLAGETDNLQNAIQELINTLLYTSLLIADKNDIISFCTSSFCCFQ